MNHKFKLKQRVAALCMAAMMCCSLFPAGAFAEAPRADADGTLIMEQDKEAVTDDSHQTEASDPDPGEESMPKISEAAATFQSADEDAPVEHLKAGEAYLSDFGANPPLSEPATEAED